MNARLLLGIDSGLFGAIDLVNADGTLHSVEDLPAGVHGNGRVKHHVDAVGLHLLRGRRNRGARPTPAGNRAHVREA